MIKAPKIERYQFGEIVVDGKIYRKDLIIHADQVLPDWWRLEGHSLAIADLNWILDQPPQTLVIGQGAYGRMAIPRGTMQHLQALGVEVISQRTGKAWQTYNELRERGTVSAALHLTC